VMTEKKIAVVTGASSGVGAAVVKRLSSSDCQVIMLARDVERMKLVAEQCDGITPFLLGVDLRNTNSVNDAFDTIKNKFGRINILCAVAGIFQEPASIANQLDSEWDDIIETNLTGTMRCLRSAWPLFASGASIVTVGSVLAEMAQPQVGAYAVSKAGLSQLTRTAATEGIKLGIRANLIIPGMIKTPMNELMAEASGDSSVWWQEKLRSTPMGRAAEPSEIAEAICWLAGDDALFITGAELRLDGGALLRPVST